MTYYNVTNSYCWVYENHTGELYSIRLYETNGDTHSTVPFKISSFNAVASENETVEEVEKQEVPNQIIRTIEEKL